MSGLDAFTDQAAIVGTDAVRVFVTDDNNGFVYVGGIDAVGKYTFLNDQAFRNKPFTEATLAPSTIRPDFLIIIATIGF